MAGVRGGWTAPGLHGLHLQPLRVLVSGAIYLLSREGLPSVPGCPPQPGVLCAFSKPHTLKMRQLELKKLNDLLKVTQAAIRV